MMAATQTTLYEKVVDVTTEYLGPASERFIDRQIRTHLDKKPQELSKKDLLKLIDWLKLVLAMLTEDDQTVDDFTSDLLFLAKP